MLGKRKDSVRMHIQGSPSIEGLLIRRTRTHYILRHCIVVKDVDTTYELDGEVKIPVGRVIMYQTVTTLADEIPAEGLRRYVPESSELPK